MEGRDVIGQAQIEQVKQQHLEFLYWKIDPKFKELQAIILCPTRELAIQVAEEELKKLSKYLKNIRVLPIYGWPAYRKTDRLKHWIKAADSDRHTWQVMDHRVEVPWI